MLDPASCLGDLPPRSSHLPCFPLWQIRYVPARVAPLLRVARLGFRNCRVALGTGHWFRTPRLERGVWKDGKHLTLSPSVLPVLRVAQRTARFIPENDALFQPAKWHRIDGPSYLNTAFLQWRRGRRSMSQLFSPRYLGKGLTPQNPQPRMHRSWPACQEPVEQLLPASARARYSRFSQTMAGFTHAAAMLKPSIKLFDSIDAATA